MRGEKYFEFLISPRFFNLLTPPPLGGPRFGQHLVLFLQEAASGSVPDAAVAMNNIRRVKGEGDTAAPDNWLQIEGGGVFFSGVVAPLLPLRWVFRRVEGVVCVFLSDGHEINCRNGKLVSGRNLNEVSLTARVTNGPFYAPFYVFRHLPVKQFTLIGETRIHWYSNSLISTTCAVFRDRNHQLWLVKRLSSSSENVKSPDHSFRSLRCGGKRPSYIGEHALFCTSLCLFWKVQKV